MSQKQKEKGDQERRDKLEDVDVLDGREGAGRKDGLGDADKAELGTIDVLDRVARES